MDNCTMKEQWMFQDYENGQIRPFSSVDAAERYIRFCEAHGAMAAGRGPYGLAVYGVEIIRPGGRIKGRIFSGLIPLGAR